MFENKGLKSLIVQEDSDVEFHKKTGSRILDHIDQFNRMNNPWYIDLNNPLPIDIQHERRWFKEYDHYYLNGIVRIEYGFHLKRLGKSYWLQHKYNDKWVMKRWTYGIVQDQNIMSIIRYLVE
jgi:hypothetical protein